MSETQCVPAAVWPTPSCIHLPVTTRIAFADPADGSTEARLPETVKVRPTFAQIYDATFPFIWRTVRRLGVDESAVDDVTQDVFVTVYRRLDDFEMRCALKT